MQLTQAHYTSRRAQEPRVKVKQVIVGTYAQGVVTVGQSAVTLSIICKNRRKKRKGKEEEKQEKEKMKEKKGRSEREKSSSARLG